MLDLQVARAPRHPALGGTYRLGTGTRSLGARLLSQAMSKACEHDPRDAFAWLTHAHQEHGRALIASGTRPIDDPAYQQRDDEIQALRLRLPAASLSR
jgi:hypothetical protein